MITTRAPDGANKSSFVLFGIVSQCCEATSILDGIILTWRQAELHRAVLVKEGKKATEF